MNDQNFSLSLSDTVARADRLDLPAEIVEFGIDQAISCDILKDVPFVGWIAKGMSIYTGITDQIFFNKILRFLTQLEALGSTEKAEFTARVATDPNFRKRVGERLIVAIDRLDEPEKSELLAKVFDCFLLGLIDYGKFSEFAHVIDRAFLADLLEISSSTQHRFIPHMERMVGSGLVDFGLSSSGSDDPGTIGYRLSTVGIELSHIFCGTFAEHLAEKERAEAMRRARDVRSPGSNPWRD